MAYLDDLKYILNIQPGSIPVPVHLSQNENGRRLYFTISGNENAFPSGTSVTISGTKPDGVVYSASGSLSNGVVLINENTQMTAVAGTWDAKIKLISAGQTVATGRVRFIIDEDTVAPGSIPSDSQLEGLIAEAQYYAENARSTAYGSPLTASTVAGMTDHTRVYVYTGSETGYTAGNWYYWDGSAWTSGGVYNSTALQTDTTLDIPGMAADAKATGDAIGDLDDRQTVSEGEITQIKSDLNYYTEESVTISSSPNNWKLDGTGKCVSDENYKMVKYAVTAGSKLHLVLSKDSNGVYQWQSAESVPSSLPNNNLIGTPITIAINGYVTVPENVTFLIVSQLKTNATNSVTKVTDTESLKSRVEDIGDHVDDLQEEVDNFEGISDEVKEALLDCFEHVAWTDEHGQDYYDALYEALYGIEPPELPDGYTKFDYIKVDKPDSVYGQTGLLRNNQILLPLTGNKNAYKYEMLLNNYAQSGAATFGGRDSAGSSDGLAFYITSNDPQTITIHCKGESYRSEKLSVLQQQEHTLHVVFNPSVNPTIVSVDDATVISRAWATPSQATDAQLALFGNPAPEAGNDIYRGVFPDQIGRLKAYNSSNELVCDCIPCSNPSGKYGMYDTVSKTFLTSSSADTYTCGNWN